MAEADVIASAVATTGRDNDEFGELAGALSVTNEAPATAENSEFVTVALSGAVPGRCRSSAEEDRSARRARLTQLRRRCGSGEEFETARSRPDWTEVGNSASSADAPSAPDLELILVENQRHFQRLVESSPRPRGFTLNAFVTNEFARLLWRSPFFTDLGGRLEVGRKIGEGGQAEIYEAVFDGKATEYVLKVFRSDTSLADLQRLWVTEIGRNYMEWKYWTGLMAYCCFVRSGTLLKDGRFAFVMKRYWGDLRKAIDFQLAKDKPDRSPPFQLSMAIKIMVQIARGMRILHANGILHRDLKAANVLLSNDIEKHIREERIGLSSLHCDIADFESSEGVMGTGFWRAPEILHALKNRIWDPKIWTEKVDVYSYAMTCYEVLSGCIPFETRARNDYDGVIGGDRPHLPDYVDPELQELLRRCWHCEPSMRPSFEEIMVELRIFDLKGREVYEGLAEDGRDAEAERWLQNFFSDPER